MHAVRVTGACVPDSGNGKAHREADILLHVANTNEGSKGAQVHHPVEPTEEGLACLGIGAWELIRAKGWGNGTQRGESA